MASEGSPARKLRIRLFPAAEPASRTSTRTLTKDLPRFGLGEDRTRRRSPPVTRSTALLGDRARAGDRATRRRRLLLLDFLDGDVAVRLKEGLELFEALGPVLRIVQPAFDLDLHHYRTALAACERSRDFRHARSSEMN